MTDATKERRNHPRAPIELKVEYRRLNTFFADYTRNISRGGTFIKTETPLPVGTEFIFHLQVPSLDTPIRLVGTVKWVVTKEEATDESPAGMGIQFIYKNQKERDEVESRVERLMIDSLGLHLYEKLLRKSSMPPK